LHLRILERIGTVAKTSSRKSGGPAKKAAGKKSAAAGKVAKAVAKVAPKVVAKSPVPTPKPAAKSPVAPTKAPVKSTAPAMKSPGKPAAPAPAAKGAKKPPIVMSPPAKVIYAQPAKPSANAANGTKPAVKPMSGAAVAKAARAAAKLNGARRAERAAMPTAPPNPLAGQVILSDGKPKKNLAGLNSRDLEHFRDLLLAKRRELVGDMSSMEREALRSTTGSISNLPIHMADMGTDNYEQEFTLGLVQKDRDILREINLALAKIQNGTYGICEGTGKPIGKPRLEAKPWARYGIEYARKLENRGVR
jgi:DnaK suppressor protein